MTQLQVYIKNQDSEIISILTLEVKKRVNSKTMFGSNENKNKLIEWKSKKHQSRKSRGKQKFNSNK